MNQYLPPPQQNMANRLSLELNQVEIVNLLMQRTGTYNQMYQRPFETNVKLNELDAITERVSNSNTTTVNPTMLSDIASAVLRPSIRPAGEVYIDNGWNTPREKFIMVAKVSYTTGATEYHYIQGYTDQPGVSNNINNLRSTSPIDTELVFIINSINRIGVNENYINGNKVVNNRIIGSDQIIFEDPYAKDSWGLRPVDVFTNISGGWLLQGMQAETNESYHMIDTRSSLHFNGPSLSKRTNCIPSNYLSSVISEYLYNASSSGYNDREADILEASANGLHEAALASNQVLQYMSKVMNMKFTNWFKFSDLEKVFPYIHNVINYANMTNEEYSSCHHAGLTERHDIMTREAITAATLAQSIPAIMTSCMINKIVFKATNRDMTGQPIIVIIDFKTLNPATSVQSLEFFKQRFEREIYKSLTYNYVDIVDLDIRCNLYGDTWINVSINGGPMTPFVYPTFCDGLTSPVKTSNSNHLNHVSAEIEMLVKNCKEAYTASHAGDGSNSVKLGKF